MASNGDVQTNQDVTDTQMEGETSSALPNGTNGHMHDHEHAHDHDHTENEAFVPVFEKLSKSLHVKKHAVWDKENKRHDLEGSVETKGLLGTDGRKYVLDLYRITPLDVAWMEEFGTALGSPEHVNGASKKAYPHRMTVL